LALASWRWLLILEGLPAILGGTAAYLLLPNRPAEAAFLTASEKDSIAVALKMIGQSGAQRASDD
jgi:ACS family tartrate transporter-like MFS transporter